MKTIKTAERDGNIIKIKFSSIDGLIFSEMLAVVRTLDGREYLNNQKIWKAFYSKSNVEKLSSAGFDISYFGDNIVIEDIKIDEEKMKGLMPFQVDGVKFLVSKNGRAIIGDDMGLGKTIQAIIYIKVCDDYPVLVVCPATVKINWRDEIKKWCGIDSYILNKRKSYSLDTIDNKIFIINFDVLKDWEKEIIKKKFKLVIMDEAQNITNSNAKRTEAAMTITDSIEKVVLMSGTLIKNGYKELFVPLNIMDKKVFSSKYRFLNRYCDPTIKEIWIKDKKTGRPQKRNFWNYDGISNEEELKRILKNYMIRREKSEVLKELPDKVKSVIPIECSEDDLIKYTDESLKFVEWAKQKRSKTEIKNKVEHLKQLAYIAKRDGMLAWIKDTIDSVGKLIVFAYHTDAINDLMIELKKYNPVMIDGSVPSENRGDIVKKFQEDESVKVFVGQIQAAGIGITLTASSTVCFTEMTWVPADHEQAEDRAHRITQKNCVNVYYLVAEGTIEKNIAYRLQRKKSIVSRVMDKDEKSFFEDNILEEIFGAQDEN